MLGSLFDLTGAALRIDGGGRAGSLQVDGSLTATLRDDGLLSLVLTQTRDTQAEQRLHTLEAHRTELSRRRSDLCHIIQETSGANEQNEKKHDPAASAEEDEQDRRDWQAVAARHSERIQELETRTNVSYTYQRTHTTTRELLEAGRFFSVAWWPVPIMWCPPAAGDVSISVESRQDTALLRKLQKEEQLVYLIGGREEFGHTSDQVWCFDVGRASWAVLPGQGRSITHHAATCLDGLLYSIGGWNGVATVGSVMCFDPLTHSWSHSQPPPALSLPRDETSAAVLSGRIYVAGGVNFLGHATTTVESWAPGESAWSPGPEMACKRRMHTLTNVNGTIIAVGGEESSEDYPRSVECLGPREKAWTTAPSLLTPRGRHAAAELDGYLYVSGGVAGGYPYLPNPVASVERFHPSSGVWTKMAPMLCARSSHASCAVGGRLYVFGGFNGVAVRNDVECFDPATNIWTAIACPMPAAKRGARALVPAVAC